MLDKKVLIFMLNVSKCKKNGKQVKIYLKQIFVKHILRGMILSKYILFLLTKLGFIVLYLTNLILLYNTTIFLTI